MLHLPAISTRTPVDIGATRELTEADLALRGSLPAAGPSPLEKIRAKHHALAQALANGMTQRLAAAMYGYTESRISILASDPAFAELVAHYQGERNADISRLTEKMKMLSSEAADELLRRIEEAPDDLTAGNLLKLLELTADRTGHGPKTTNDVNVFVGLAERMQAARQRIVPEIDITPNTEEPS